MSTVDRIQHSTFHLGLLFHGLFQDVPCGRQTSCFFARPRIQIAFFSHHPHHCCFVSHCVRRVRCRRVADLVFWHVHGLAGVGVKQGHVVPHRQDVGHERLSTQGWRTSGVQSRRSQQGQRRHALVRQGRHERRRARVFAKSRALVLLLLLLLVGRRASYGLQHRPARPRVGRKRQVILPRRRRRSWPVRVRAFHDRFPHVGRFDVRFSSSPSSRHLPGLGDAPRARPRAPPRRRHRRSDGSRDRRHVVQIPDDEGCEGRGGDAPRCRTTTVHGWTTIVGGEGTIETGAKGWRNPEGRKRSARQDEDVSRVGALPTSHRSWGWTRRMEHAVRGQGGGKKKKNPW
mmetsp:Transcript_4204/g.26654  ORF Transcript_4204/g.26654 Transcript_4204/m.26654 type:complete len:344 (-) Transcript_4204:2263-3294(-)